MLRDCRKCCLPSALRPDNDLPDLWQEVVPSHGRRACCPAPDLPGGSLTRLIGARHHTGSAPAAAPHRPELFPSWGTVNLVLWRRAASVSTAGVLTEVTVPESTISAVVPCFEAES